jgi:hypothetical protein
MRQMLVNLSLACILKPGVYFRPEAGASVGEVIRYYAYCCYQSSFRATSLLYMTVNGMGGRHILGDGCIERRLSSRWHELSAEFQVCLAAPLLLSVNTPGLVGR